MARKHKTGSDDSEYVRGDGQWLRLYNIGPINENTFAQWQMGHRSWRLPETPSTLVAVLKVFMVRLFM